MKTLIFGVLTLFQISALGQNLLTNGTFDSDVSDWFGAPTVYSWSDTMGGPISGAGSVYMEKEIINNNRIFGISSSRVAVNENDTYWFAGMGYIPSSSSAFRAWARVTWYDAKGTNLTSPSIFDFSFPTDVWAPVEGSVTAPEGAVEAGIAINIESDAPPKGETFLSFGYWDDVYFFEDTIFRSNFD
ncbi:hypothetical protein [Marinicella sp. W31]|uniref:hypothetical protein n=1 Tax=Marinicella sp. W31 TaxID=3023713 RepID=UPI00375689D2